MPHQLSLASQKPAIAPCRRSMTIFPSTSASHHQRVSRHRQYPHQRRQCSLNSSQMHLQHRPSQQLSPRQAIHPGTCLPHPSTCTVLPRQEQHLHLMMAHHCKSLAACLSRDQHQHTMQCMPPRIILQRPTPSRSNPIRTLLLSGLQPCQNWQTILQPGLSMGCTFPPPTHASRSMLLKLKSRLCVSVQGRPRLWSSPLGLSPAR